MIVLNPPTPFRVSAQTAALRSMLPAFVPDAAASKLARMRRTVGVAARAIEVVNVDLQRPRCCMVTLTYRGTNADWSPRHVSQFIKTAREWLRRRGVPLRYVWVAELQRRGVIHYHVALWLPEGVNLPKPDDAGWWPHGMTRIETARKAVPYLMKYLSKANDAAHGSLPERARSHGRGGLGDCWREVVRWLGLPSFIQARCDVRRQWQRFPGGGWVSPDGEWLPSEFARRFVGSAWSLVRVHDHGRPFDVAGPYSSLQGVA